MSRLRERLTWLYRQMPTLRKIGKVFVIFLVCLVAAFFLTRGILTVVYGQKLNAEVARLKSLGGSTDILTLAPRVRPKGEDNVAYMLQAAALLYQEPRLKSPRGDEYEKPGSGNFDESARMGTALYDFDKWEGLKLDSVSSPGLPWKASWVPYVEQNLADNDLTLSIVRKAAPGEGAFEVQWKNLFSAMMSHLAGMRNEARLLRRDAVIKASKGDISGAFDDVRLTLRLRRFIKDEPSVISSLVGFSLDDTAFAALHGVLQFGSPDRATVKALLKELEGRESFNSLTKAYMGEAAVGYEYMERARRDPEALKGLLSVDSTDPDPFWGMGRFIWIGTADEYYFLRRANGAIEATQQPFPQGLSGLQEVPMREEWMLIFPLNFTTWHISSGYSRAILHSGAQNAETGMARAALALALYKADNSRYPDTLAALVPQYLPRIDTDPFDGKPLKYKPRGDGFVLYSVGQNQLDDGGTAGGMTNRGVTANGDIVWEMAK